MQFLVAMCLSQPAVQVETNKTSPLESDGAFMLGNEQDCYGGCTDSSQAFYGLMDEVITYAQNESNYWILCNFKGFKAYNLACHACLKDSLSNSKPFTYRT